MFLIWIFESNPHTAGFLRRTCYMSFAALSSVRVTVFSSVARALPDPSLVSGPNLILADPASNPALEQWIRFRQQECRTDLIILTEDASPSAFFRARSLAPCDYLIKPVSADRLRLSIDGYLHRRRMLPAFSALTQEDVDRFLWYRPSFEEKKTNRCQASFAADPDPSSQKELLLRVLPLFTKEHPQLSTKEVSELLCVSRVSAGRYLRRLFDLGRLTKKSIPDGGRGRPTDVYELRRTYFNTENQIEQRRNQE